MSKNTFTSEIINRFSSDWSALSNGVKVSYPNQPFDPDSSSAWVKISVRFPVESQASIGGELNRFDTSGFVTVRINVPELTGDALTLQLVDDISEIFVSNATNSVQFLDQVNVDDIGSNPPWYVTNVVIPFTAYTFK